MASEILFLTKSLSMLIYSSSERLFFLALCTVIHFFNNKKRVTFCQNIHPKFRDCAKQNVPVKLGTCRNSQNIGHLNRQS